ncbi:hypothetical protein HanRHA438_Chr14g0646131 [Helianthus annuus]|nr:hypothetical protein HanRHA438_Chr14g0646131 [Helianthus annuus]
MTVSEVTLMIWQMTMMVNEDYYRRQSKIRWSFKGGDERRDVSTMRMNGGRRRCRCSPELQFKMVAGEVEQ